MSKCNRIAFLVEGAKQEMNYLHGLAQTFFKEGTVELFYLPAKQNIYSLWRRCKEDDFQQESCLPYSGSCTFPCADMKQYKRRSGHKNNCADVRKYTAEIWRSILEVFLMRCHCLMGETGRPLESYRKLESEDNPQLSVFEKIVTKQAQTGEVFILSAFPAFILSYFKAEKWTGEWVLSPVYPCNSPKGGT